MAQSNDDQLTIPSLDFGLIHDLNHAISHSLQYKNHVLNLYEDGLEPHLYGAPTTLLSRILD